MRVFRKIFHVDLFFKNKVLLQFNSLPKKRKKATCFTVDSTHFSLRIISFEQRLKYNLKCKKDGNGF